MKDLRQVIFGILAALLSVAILAGSFALAMVESNQVLSSRPTPTAFILTLPPAGSQTTAQPTATLKPSNTAPAPTETDLPPSPTVHTVTATTTSTAQPCTPPAHWNAIFVEAGDTLDLLAKKYNITPTALAQSNCLVTTILQPGDILYVPPLPVVNTTIPCGPPKGWVLYTVQPGDTLYSLSQILDVSIAQLQQANCLGSSILIRAGKPLYVPFIPIRTATATKVPLPLVMFKSAAYSVDEAGGTASITVILSKASGQTVSVNYATSNGSALAGSDYTTASGTLTFNPGTTSQTFSVPILNDSADEPDETLNLALSSPLNAALGSPATAVLTILDEDAPLPSVSFRSAVDSVGEADGTVTIRVDLSSASSSTVTVSYATSNGTAAAGEDYTAASGTLTFDPGNTTLSIIVTILNNDDSGSNESFSLTLSSPSNATLGSPAVTTLTIIDDDSA